MGSKPVVRPPRLGRGSRVALVAPAGPLLERDDITRAEELCRALGYEPVVAPHAAERYGYLAGTDADRLADLNAAFRDSRDRCDLVPARGLRRDADTRRRRFRCPGGRPRAGHRLLGHHGPARRGHPNRRSGGLSRSRRPPCHAVIQPTALRAGADAGRGRRELSSISCRRPTFSFLVTTGSSRSGGVSPKARSRAGISPCYSASSEPVGFPTSTGRILVLEEVNEDLYRVDRMLAHLRAVGSLTGWPAWPSGDSRAQRHTPDGAFGFDELLSQYLLPLSVPVVLGLPFGHIDEQWTLPLGVRARLDADAAPSRSSSLRSPEEVVPTWPRPTLTHHLVPVSSATSASTYAPAAGLAPPGRGDGAWLQGIQGLGDVALARRSGWPGADSPPSRSISAEAAWTSRGRTRIPGTVRPQHVFGRAR